MAVLANNLYKSGGVVTTQYNNSVGIAFDNSIVNAATVSILPTIVVVNCLGGQTVMLKGTSLSPIAC